MKIVIAQLLDSTSATLAKTLSKSCEPYAIDPPLVLQEHTQINPAIPHIAHLHLEIDPDRLTDLFSALQELTVADPRECVSGHFTGITSVDGWLRWETDADENLQRLNAQIIELTVSMGQTHSHFHRDGWFEPRVTLSVLRDPPPFRSDIVRAYSTSHFPWHSDLLVIGQLGPRGTLTKILGRLPLLGRQPLIVERRPGPGEVQAD